MGFVSSQCGVSSACRTFGQASREAARLTWSYNKIQESKGLHVCSKPLSERPRGKNKTSREVGKYLEMSATSHRNRRTRPRSKQTRADKAQPNARKPRRRYKERSYIRPRRSEERLLEKPRKEGSPGRTGPGSPAQGTKQGRRGTPRLTKTYLKTYLKKIETKGRQDEQGRGYSGLEPRYASLPCLQSKDMHEQVVID